MAYGKVYKEIQRTLDIRWKAAYAFYDEQQADILAELEYFTRDTIEPWLSELFEINETLSFSHQDLLPKEEAKRRLDKAADIVIGIVSSLLEVVIKEFPLIQYIQFLSYSSFNKCYFPDSYAIPFEYNRMKFTRDGSMVIDDTQKQISR